MDRTELRTQLADGLFIPAHPLALTDAGKLSESHQRALTRYYLNCGVGGIAVGVHTTQFEIHDPACGLLEPVWHLAHDIVNEGIEANRRRPVMIAGVVGDKDQAIWETEMAASLGFDCVLVSFTALHDRNEEALLDYVRAIAEVLPVFGFYLQEAVGGRHLDYRFWRKFLEIEDVVAIKVAPFDRYRTIDVARAVADSGRENVALYTGNDDHWILDLLTPFRWETASGTKQGNFSGGLLGHWAFWTRSAVELFQQCKQAQRCDTVSLDWLQRDMAETDCNAAAFDARHRFAGCNAGVLEMLRRDRLVPSARCLDGTQLSPNQNHEIDRVWNQYPLRRDSEFIAQHIDAWLA